jgi:hypothetical protein
MYLMMVDAIDPQWLDMHHRQWLGGIGMGTGAYCRPMISFFWKLSRKDRHQIYISFREYVRGQEYLRQSNHEKALLQLALAALPGLDTISYHEPTRE